MTGVMLLDAGEIARDAGGMLRDAADALVDAGAWLGDAGAEAKLDAQAQTPSSIELACDHEYTRTDTMGASVTVQSSWYAELAADTADVSAIDTVLCGREALGSDPYVTPCAAGATCTGMARPPLAQCEAQASAELAPGLVRVLCGYRTRTTQSGAVSYDSGYRFRTARVTVRR
jgi:hypothetical protein